MSEQKTITDLRRRLSLARLELAKRNKADELAAETITELRKEVETANRHLWDAQECFTEENKHIASLNEQIATLERQLAAAREQRSGFYVASRASLPERGQMWRNLRANGIKINSSWIDEDGDGQTGDFSELWSRIEREVTSSEALILYAEPGDFPLKGALIEVGMALSAGVPVYAVLPRVELEPRSRRPVGSWLAHPLVLIAESIEQVVNRVSSIRSLSRPTDACNHKWVCRLDQQQCMEDCHGKHDLICDICHVSKSDLRPTEEDGNVE